MGSVGASSSFANGGGEAKVIEEVLEVSADEDRVELLRYPDTIECYSPEEAITRARTKLGESAYGVYSNNCECLVNWAIMGESVSLQASGGTLSVGLGAVLGAVSAYYRNESWTGIFKDAATGASKGYLQFREKRQ